MLGCRAPPALLLAAGAARQGTPRVGRVRVRARVRGGKYEGLRGGSRRASCSAQAPWSMWWPPRAACSCLRPLQLASPACQVPLCLCVTDQVQDLGSDLICVKCGAWPRVFRFSAESLRSCIGNLRGKRSVSGERGLAVPLVRLAVYIQCAVGRCCRWLRWDARTCAR